jgi:hypothetical protein
MDGKQSQACPALKKALDFADYVLKFFFLRVFRMIAMIAMAILLTATAIMSSHKLWYTGMNEIINGHTIVYTSFNCPSLCLVDNRGSNIGGIPFKWTIADYR